MHTLTVTCPCCRTKAIEIESMNGGTWRCQSCSGAVHVDSLDERPDNWQSLIDKGEASLRCAKSAQPVGPI